VQLPVKAHYATIAMIELANRSPDAPPVSLRAIAAKHQIPLPFLTQIFQQLRAAGLANSVRGASGGFLLQRSSETISIAEIVDAVCPGPPSSTVSGKTAEHAAVQQIWDGLDELIKNHLRGLLLSELVEQTQPAQATMFYI
jgi:Rrf2 family protein